ncbi:hypothetical protein [Sedimentitalea sp.]|uniref:hypothetical protein n=1 Tax=Sedimentitalea sp. TaxID=2048915 RepID=UPI00329807B6
MKQFEYQIHLYPMDGKTSLVEMQDDLNARGQNGWEVVAISTSEFVHLGHTAFFKRVMDSARAREDDT